MSLKGKIKFLHTFHAAKHYSRIHIKTICSYIMVIAISVFSLFEGINKLWVELRGVSRAAATSKMECFVIIVKGFNLDVAAALDPPLELGKEKTRKYLSVYEISNAHCKLNSKALPLFMLLVAATRQKQSLGKTIGLSMKHGN